jgi:hypothetical protein
MLKVHWGDSRQELGLMNTLEQEELERWQVNSCYISEATTPKARPMSSDRVLFLQGIPRKASGGPFHSGKDGFVLCAVRA